MRKKVRKSLAFLLALALVVSVMSGLGLSVSADDAQNEPVVTETEGEPAEEKPKAEENTSAEGGKEETADPDAEAVPEEKKDEQKAEGEGSSEKAAENKDAATPKAGENVQTATIGTGDKTVTVKTTAAAGVLPEGAKLVVKKLANQDQAYQDAESTLKDSQVTYDDFLALDVGFEVNGKEVEPEAGSVQVQFELGAGLLPETANLDSLSVQHLTDGKAETVTNEVAVTESGVKADFTVSSFSTFTITWWGDGDYNKYYEFTVHYVDEKGNEINPSASNIELSYGKTINFFNEYSNSIKGYQWLNAYYGSYTQNGTNRAITTMEASGDRTKQYYGFSWYWVYQRYNITFKNGNKVVQSFQQKQSEKPTAQTGDIYLVFQKNTTGDTGGTIGDITLPAPGHTKKAVSKGDGTYDLSLDVSGSIGSEAKKIPLDVVMIIDRSGSMNDNERIKKVQKAANKLIDGLSNNNNLDVNYNIVTFSSLSTQAGEYSVSEDDAKTYGWTESADVAKGNINGITATGGTNYQAGIRLAKKQLNLARSGVQTAVIFFTDGIPTFRLSNPYDEYGYGGVYYGNGQDDSGSRNINAAVDEIKGMYTNRFYAIGTSGANKDNLNSLSNGVNASDKKVYAIDDKDIGTTFDAIEKEINKLTCTNVSITDTLNENAQIVKTAGGKTPLTITVTDKDGKVIDKKSGADEVTLTLKETEQNKGEVADRTLTATYVEDAVNGRQIKLIFPDKYSLEADYTYTVTTPIEPTERAYEQYRGKGETYPDTPDAGTGTHADNNKEKGFYCNDTAQLKYDNGKGDKTVDYDKPVIQLTPGKLVIEKTIAGELTDKQVTALENDLTFKYKLNKGTEQSAKLTNWTKNADDTYTASATVASGLSPNTEYTVTEANENVEGYVVDTTTSSATGTISKGETKTASFTNTYTKATQDLTITKVIENQSPKADFKLDTSKTKYTFTVTADAGVDVADKTYTTDRNTNVPFDASGEATVTIQGEGSIVIKDLPVGSYTVTEQESEDVTGYDFKRVTYAPIGGKATLTSTTAGQVTVTNKYEIKKVDVTVKKVLDGNMYDSKDRFIFKATGVNDFDLANNETQKITVDYGSTFTVTEEANSKGYELTSVVSNKSGGKEIDNGYEIEGVTEDTTITFTNTKTIQPPNGIITTIAPYAIMVVLAAGAGVYFVYSRRRHNG